MTQISLTKGTRQDTSKYFLSEDYLQLTYNDWDMAAMEESRYHFTVINKVTG